MSNTRFLDKSIFYDGIDNELRTRRSTMILSIVMSSIVAIMSVGLCLYYVRKTQDTIYVVDKGEAFSAHLSNSDSQRSLEIEDHLRRFHDLMFNLFPSPESQKRSFEAAFSMSDRSAYKFYLDQNESGYFSKLISSNITQELQIDSVRFDLNSYPYPADVYGKLILTRESNISEYSFQSRCVLSDTKRSLGNPHGLMIENFSLVKYGLLSKRKRN